MEDKKDILSQFIIFDLETIGLERETGKIIEIAALKIEDWEITKEYSQLVNPEIKVPRVITNLTGIRNADVKDHPTIKECLGSFLEFIGDLPIVGHNLISFDKPFIEYNLKRHGLGNSLDNLSLDTLELSIFLLPELRKHKLEYLYGHLTQSDAKQRHRARDDCLMTFEVLKKLKETRDTEWDGNWLEHVGVIAKNQGWSWGDFILSHKSSLELGQKVDSYLSVENYIGEINWGKFKKIEDEESADDGGQSGGQKSEEPEYVKVNKDDIRKIFNENGGRRSLRAVLGRQYEYRKQQEDMAVNVAQSINENKNLVIEAPTGCGKSLAYLIPAVCWSIKNRNLPVIISTYTNALQDQLFENDFKSVRQLFDANIKITVAKGRDHYVCIRKFKKYIAEIFEQDHAGQLFAGESRFSKKLFSVFLANWIIRNKFNNCDLDRFPYWLKSKADKFNNGLINSTRDSCQRRFCEYYNKCFVNKLKLATRESNVIVSNHSLVFSDPWDNPSLFSVLPNNFKVLIIDEAVNIEDAATNAGTASYSKNEFERLAKEFYDKARPKKGFLNRIGKYLEKTGDEKLYSRVGNIQETASRLLQNNQVLFDILADEVSGRTLEYDDKKEIFPFFLEQSETPLQNLSIGLNETAAFLDTIRSLYCGQNKNSFCQEVKNYQARFGDYYNFIAVLTELNKDEYIFYRVIKASSDDLSLNYCPKDIGKYLDNNLYGKDLKSIIFTSATLTYDNSFSFVKKIWGLNRILDENLDYARLPYLFDYEKQCALILINDLPNRNRDDQEENQKFFYPLTAQFLNNLLIANNGSSLLLFTNKKDVAKFSELLIDNLENNNIPLYSTERSNDLRIMSGNKSSVVDEFKECVESCLIGTAGLREGIDIPGNSLEMVVIVKLPFDVPSDPINKNRQLAYGGFDGYSLPHCMFNIKQAFGRLIRTKMDNGFVFIVDARIINYIARIKNNLPAELNILNLDSIDFEDFNNLLIKTKGMKGRVGKILDRLSKNKINNNQSKL